MNSDNKSDVTKMFICSFTIKYYQDKKILIRKLKMMRKELCQNKGLVNSIFPFPVNLGALLLFT